MKRLLYSNEVVVVTQRSLLHGSLLVHRLPESTRLLGTSVSSGQVAVEWSGARIEFGLDVASVVAIIGKSRFFWSACLLNRLDFTTDPRYLFFQPRYRPNVS